MKKIKKIYYQGSEGSYSESVLEDYFKDAEYISCSCLLYTSPSARD